ncbi:unnamed protein product [Auanema sp. JU1783]|nr:unnamed protein product [Auanema sp. JU1783]
MESEQFPLIDDTARDETGGNLGRPGGGGTVSSHRRLSVLHIPGPKNLPSNEENVRSVIHQCARNGKGSSLKENLEKHPEVINNRDQDGFTALHYACRYGHCEIVSFLLEKGADPNIESGAKLTALHMVAKYGREGSRSSLESDVPVIDRGSSIEMIIRLLIEREANINVGDEYALTPLHYTAMKGNLIAAQALLEYGEDKIDLVIEDNHGMTPLLTSCVYGADEVAALLLKKGANYRHIIQAKKETASTALHIAAQHGNARCVRLILERATKGGDCETLLKMQNDEGKTPLYLAIEGNHPVTAKVILDRIYKTKENAKLALEGKEIWLVHLTAERGYLDALKLLVEAGADYNLQDDDERIPIHMAAMHNHVGIVEYLLTKNKDMMEARDERGFTPLLLAVSFHDAINVAKELIEQHANLEVTDNDERTVIFIAAKFNSRRCLEHILNLIKKASSPRRIHPTSLRLPAASRSLDDMVNHQDHNQDAPMHVVCGNGYLEVCQLLFDHGAFIDILNEDEETPIHRAALRGRVDVLRQLVEWDRRLVTAKDEKGYTPLHCAAQEGFDDAVVVLLDAGAEIDSRNADDKSPLQLAVMYNQLDTLRELARRGADVDRSGEDGNSPLLEAARNGNDEIVRFLINDRNCDVCKRNDKKQTALDLALENKHRDVVRTLITSEYWKDLIHPRDVIELNNVKAPKIRKTPMRQLMSTFPELVPAILDKLITRNGEPQDYNFTVEYDFTYLDDTFMMPDSGYLINDERDFETHDDISQKDLEVKTKNIRLLGSIDPYEQDGTSLRTEAQLYSKKHEVIYMNHPLKLIANSEKITLLSHELVDELIKYKWNSVGRQVYYTALFFYMVFIMLYTIYVTHTPAPYNVFDKRENGYVDISLQLEAFNGTCSDLGVERPQWVAALKIIIIIISSCELLKEAYQLYSRCLAYFSFENFVECFIYSSSIISILDFTECAATAGIPLSWQWNLAAVCSFLGWMNVLMLIRKTPKFGIYVVMFFDILSTFSTFFFIFVLFVVSFSTSFFVIMQNRPEFATPWDAIIKTTVMMIGEFEFTALFYGDKEVHMERLFGPQLAYPLFLGFCIVMTILLMNLLVGLAVDDIKAVQEKAELRRKVLMVDLVLQVEITMPWLRRKRAVGKYRIFKNQQGWIKKIISKFDFMSGRGEDSDVENTEEEAVIAEFRDDLRYQGSQIKNLQENIDYIWEKELKLERMLKAILKHHKIETEDFDRR